MVDQRADEIRLRRPLLDRLGEVLVLRLCGVSGFRDHLLCRHDGRGKNECQSRDQGPSVGRPPSPADDNHGQRRRGRAVARGNCERAEAERAAASIRLLGEAMKVGILAACASISPCTPPPCSCASWSSGRRCAVVDRQPGRRRPPRRCNSWPGCPANGRARGAAPASKNAGPRRRAAQCSLSRAPIADDRLVAFEFLRIVERDGGLVYIAQPNGRPPTEFVLTKIDAGSATFENPSHDFPKTIRYTRREDGSLEATISGANGEKAQSFVFTRQAGR